ncbi:MAG: hypothetical protein H0X17_22740 [Deltaproteobacteria bacterium]|nr:hypothetical protein [Deltaproteobacteria bacterium]
MRMRDLDSAFDSSDVVPYGGKQRATSVSDTDELDDVLAALAEELAAASLPPRGTRSAR